MRAGDGSVHVTDAQLADGLINTRTLPPGLMSIQKLASQARAYHVLKPYPLWWFKNWKEEDRGPLPRCMPIAKAIIRRGAQWLFGKPLEISFPGNESLQERVREVWDENRMPSRLTAIARQGGLDGGVVLKFAYDELAEPAISIQSLSLTNQVRLYFHPHNREKLLMARVQYPYYDPIEACTYWYREEWTEAREVHYYPVKDESMHRSDPDTYEGWVIDEAYSRPNPFQLIPLHRIKNIETDDVWGAGDLWDIDDEPDGGLYRVLDRIHLTYHLMDRSNQFDSTVNPIYIDLDVDDDDLMKPLQPSQALSLESKNAGSDGSQGKVVFPSSGNGLRPAMMEYAKDLRKQVLDSAGSVWVDQAEFSNKGNLTNAVLAQLYLPQIEVTEDKKRSYGADGLIPFLGKMARGLQRAGVDLGVNDKDKSTWAAELKWPAYFQLSQDELTAAVGRTQEEELAGYLPHARAIRIVAALEGIEDVEALEDELEKQPEPVLATSTATNAAAMPIQKPDEVMG